MYCSGHENGHIWWYEPATAKLTISFPCDQKPTCPPSGLPPGGGSLDLNMIASSFQYQIQHLVVDSYADDRVILSFMFLKPSSAYLQREDGSRPVEHRHSRRRFHVISWCMVLLLTPAASPGIFIYDAKDLRIILLGYASISRRGPMACSDAIWGSVSVLMLAQRDRETTCLSHGFIKISQQSRFYISYRIFPPSPSLLLAFQIATPACVSCLSTAKPFVVLK